MNVSSSRWGLPLGSALPESILLKVTASFRISR